MVNLSVPVIPWNEKGDIEKMMRIAYGEQNCISRFQEPGVIEAVPAKIGTKLSFEKFLTFRDPEPFFFFGGRGISTFSREDPSYLAILELGLAAPLHGAGAKVMVPSKYIVGDLDLAYYRPDTIDHIHNGGFKKDVPLLEEVIVMKM
ncbi:alpha/beta hydrolase fold-1 [Tanacetum coccineum]